MTFDSNRAWQDALAAVRTNREVLLALAGVFFLLPTVLSTVFLSDVQARMLENMGNAAVLDKLMQDNMGLVLGFGFGGIVVQLVGYVAVMALLGDRRRPTVGQAITRGLRGLPTLLLIAVAFLFGVMVLSALLSAGLGGVFALLGARVMGGLLAIAAILAAIVYASVRLSLVLPVVVNDQKFGPVQAIVRSWRLTRGCALRLLTFYILLAIGYLVIAMVVTMAVLGPVMLVLGQGQGSRLAIGLVSGVIAGASGVILTAVLAQAHRQLGEVLEEPSAPLE